MVKILDSAIKQFSDLIKSKLGINVSNLPGAGAEGGLGAGAVAFMNAEIVSGIDTIMNVVKLQNDMQNADWIITGEGKFDSQSLNGKVISGIVKLAKKTNTKVMVIAGDVRLDKSIYRSFGIVDAIGLKEKNMTTEYAMLDCERLLKNASSKFTEKHIIK